jgi:hypothetical protein
MLTEVIDKGDKEKNTLLSKSLLRQLVERGWGGGPIADSRLPATARVSKLNGPLLGKQNTIVVMGAFDRSWLSGVFKPATAGLLSAAQADA